MVNWAGALPGPREPWLGESRLGRGPAPAASLRPELNSSKKRRPGRLSCARSRGISAVSGAGPRAGMPISEAGYRLSEGSQVPICSSMAMRRGRGGDLGPDATIRETGKADSSVLAVLGVPDALASRL